MVAACPRSTRTPLIACRALHNAYDGHGGVCRHSRRHGIVQLPDFVSDHENGMTWSYQEVAFPTLGGQLDLSATLYEYIRIHRPPGVAVETAPRGGVI